MLGPDGKVEARSLHRLQGPGGPGQAGRDDRPDAQDDQLLGRREPVVALTYYATHPQSYYRTGLANPDFPGMARDQRQEATRLVHIHFDGAGGNIGAGKWNDGSPENRQILADRVAAGMAKAWQATDKTPIKAADMAWESVPVALPPAPHLDEAALEAVVNDASKPVRERSTAATELVWLRRCLAGDTIDIACLHLGKAGSSTCPANCSSNTSSPPQKLRPDLFVAMAAYGDYAPGYIGTEIAYPQGGYETGPHASLVAPGVERILMDVIKKLLTPSTATPRPSS